MTRKYFGTDGVRGLVGKPPISPDFVMRLGYAAGRVLAQKTAGSERPAVLIGKDTRVSGYMLESALEAGLSAAGVDVLLVGPMPTPGVAYLTRALRLSAGIVISASHNPHQDNGIKFFSADGNKLADATESAIEAAMEQPLRCQPSAGLGKARRVDDAAGRYIEFCKSTFPANLDLHGLRIAVDCAHGAAYHIAPHVFHELGAEVITVGAQPDGFNINKGVGATHAESLQRAVRRSKADIGIALDGDGDRLIMADGSGRVYDGDELLYVVGAHRKRTRVLKGGVVGTQMTNLAMAQALAKLKIPFARARVGDRYVLELLKQRGWQLGGENSGHIVCLDRHTTGDGIVSALQVLQALLSANIELAKAVDFVLYPQVLINVQVAGRTAREIVAAPGVKKAVAAAERALGNDGRVLLRPSGTEPVIRVMVEGESRRKVADLAGRIAAAVRKS
ncbi:MAG: phosphoglucosamine mutase [Burkholderiales bacterium]